jgi:hypothetical protein
MCKETAKKTNNSINSNNKRMHRNEEKEIKINAESPQKNTHKKKRAQMNTQNRNSLWSQA